MGWEAWGALDNHPHPLGEGRDQGVQSVRHPAKNPHIKVLIAQNLHGWSQQMVL